MLRIKLLKPRTNNINTAKLLAEHDDPCSNCRISISWNGYHFFDSDGHRQYTKCTKLTS
jgi:hypothetical protein